MTACGFEQPYPCECCAAAGWVQQRMAASYRARQDFNRQIAQQLIEEVAAAEARRPAVLVVQPTLRLDLPDALQHPPPRLDMCSVCTRQIEEAEMRELSSTGHAEHLQKCSQRRKWQPATVAASPGAPPAGEAQQPWQRQQQGDGSSGGKKDEPDTPTQQQQQQQQHASSEEEPEQHKQDAAGAPAAGLAGGQRPAQLAASSAHSAACQ